jgi:dUTPase
MVALINNPTIPFQVQPGDRIAPSILEKILKVNPMKTRNISEIVKGDEGFSSLGKEQILKIGTITSIKAIK